MTADELKALHVFTETMLDIYHYRATGCRQALAEISEISGAGDLEAELLQHFQDSRRQIRKLNKRAEQLRLCAKCPGVRE